MALSESNPSIGGNAAALIVPAAVLGTVGYGYMRWKGLSFSDLMYVTKKGMSTAVLSLTKHLEHVSDALAIEGGVCSPINCRDLRGLMAFLTIRNHGPVSMPGFVAKDFLKEFYNNRKERAELAEAWVVPDNEVRPIKLSQEVHLIWGVINIGIRQGWGSCSPTGKGR